MKRVVVSRNLESRIDKWFKLSNFRSSVVCEASSIQASKTLQVVYSEVDAAL